MKYVLIVNPTSGQGKSLEISRKLENICMEKGIDYDVYHTEKPMDAANIAKKYRDDENITIFSFGGDGTLNEIIQSLDGAKCKLEIIPSGTGNDFYKVVKNIKEPNKKIDLGHVNKEFFINTMSIGIDAVVSKNVEYMKANKFIPKNQKYNASVLYSLFNYEPYNLEVYIDNMPLVSKEEKVWLMTICNGTTYGGGFKIAPHAEVDDDYLDMYLIRNIDRKTLLKILVALIKGEHENCKEVEHYKVKRVHVKSDIELPYSLDGENLLDNEFKVSIEHNSVTLNNDKELVKELMKLPKKKNAK